MRGERGEGAKGRGCRLVEFCGRMAGTVAKDGRRGVRQLTRSAHRCKIYGSAFIAKPREKNVNGAAALQMKAWHDTSRKARRGCATNVEMSRRADPREIQNLVSNAEPPKRHSLKCKFLVCWHYARLMCEGRPNTSWELERDGR